MNLVDLQVWATDAVAQIHKLEAMPLWQLCILIFGFVGGVSAAIIKLTKYVRGRIQAHYDQRISSALYNNTHARSFSNDEIGEARKNYIEPNSSNLDPSNDIDVRLAVSVREPVFSVLDRELAHHAKHYIIVLADSGMGKTTLLLNYFRRELQRSKATRRPIALVPLGREDALEQIRNVERQRDTILLLDALDEDTAAISNCASRVQALMKAVADFRSVVLTCRTQFFLHDDSIPTQTGILRVAPRRAGTSSTHEFKKIYLLPFTDIQVGTYIRKAIPWWQPLLRRQATEIVKKIPELSARPMLLALIPDLIKSKIKVNELWELYEFMVSNWLRRESAWIIPSDLLRISQNLAVELFKDRDRRMGERIPHKELLEVLHLSNESVEGWKLTTRSLLNRDSAGNYKFAHRSIMEFLFVNAFCEGNMTCAAVEWTDMMCELFLSWGRHLDRTNDSSRAASLLKSDLSATKLFPIVQGVEPASTLDAHWAKSALSKSGSAGVKSGLPVSWRRYTSRHLQRVDVSRIYEFAEGLVWQLTMTTGITSPEDRGIYRVDRHQQHWTSEFHPTMEWTTPYLAELRSLAEVLATDGSLHRCIDTRELLWLADQDQEAVALARVRWGDDSRSSPPDFPRLTLLHSEAVDDPGQVAYAIDVYRAPKIQPAASKLRAFPILTHRGCADAVWQKDAARVGADEKAIRNDWNVRTESVALAEQVKRRRPGSLTRKSRGTAGNGGVKV